jgi:hypothetical protein
LPLASQRQDYIGHAFGPNSVEEEDCYLRLDQALGELFDYLDEKVGEGAMAGFSFS